MHISLKASQGFHRLVFLRLLHSLFTPSPACPLYCCRRLAAPSATARAPAALEDVEVSRVLARDGAVVGERRRPEDIVAVDAHPVRRAERGGGVVEGELGRERLLLAVLREDRPLPLYAAPARHVRGQRCEARRVAIDARTAELRHHVARLARGVDGGDTLGADGEEDIRGGGGVEAVGAGDERILELERGERRRARARPRRQRALGVGTADGAALPLHAARQLELAGRGRRVAQRRVGRGVEAAALQRLRLQQQQHAAPQLRRARARTHPRGVGCAQPPRGGLGGEGGAQLVHRLGRLHGIRLAAQGEGCRTHRDALVSTAAAALAAAAALTALVAALALRSALARPGPNLPVPQQVPRGAPRARRLARGDRGAERHRIGRGCPTIAAAASPQQRVEVAQRGAPLCGPRESIEDAVVRDRVRPHASPLHARRKAERRLPRAPATARADRRVVAHRVGHRALTAALTGALAGAPSATPSARAWRRRWRHPLEQSQRGAPLCGARARADGGVVRHRVGRHAPAVHAQQQLERHLPRPALVARRDGSGAVAHVRRDTDLAHVIEQLDREHPLPARRARADRRGIRHPVGLHACRVHPAQHLQRLLPPPAVAQRAHRRGEGDHVAHAEAGGPLEQLQRRDPLPRAPARRDRRVERVHVGRRVGAVLHCRQQLQCAPPLASGAAHRDRRIVAVPRGLEPVHTHRAQQREGSTPTVGRLGLCRDSGGEREGVGTHGVAGHRRHLAEQRQRLLPTTALSARVDRRVEMHGVGILQAA
eukprot:scaffold59240_cov66-Phaeocystis_antarctica.AAC.3